MSIIPELAIILVAVKPENQDQYLKILREREDELSPSQEKRVGKIFRCFN